MSWNYEIASTEHSSETLNDQLLIWLTGAVVQGSSTGHAEMFVKAIALQSRSIGQQEWEKADCVHKNTRGSEKGGRYEAASEQHAVRSV